MNGYGRSNGYDSGDMGPEMQEQPGGQGGCLRKLVLMLALAAMSVMLFAIWEMDRSDRKHTEDQAIILSLSGGQGAPGDQGTVAEAQAPAPCDAPGASNQQLRDCVKKLEAQLADMENALRQAQAGQESVPVTGGGE